MASDNPTPIDFQKLRLDGVYRMNDRDDLMVRIKIPAGVLSANQGEKIAELAAKFAGARLHLTTRGSIELHRVRHENLADIGRGLAHVGLSGRGACGGAVRGITCSTSFSPDFAHTQALARRLHRHFTGNPHFEGLPKKFKIAVEDGYAGARHLIQDAGIVLAGRNGGENRYDLWVGGGLGREPQPGFLLEPGLKESRLLPLLEAVLRTYRKHTPAGKRLKHLVGRIGEENFRRLLQQELDGSPSALFSGGLDGILTRSSAEPVHVPIFAGDLGSDEFGRLIQIACTLSEGVLAVTADQNIAFAPSTAEKRSTLIEALRKAGFLADRPEEQTTFRICVGSHACRMGLAPTRDIARDLIRALPDQARGLSWAISGCPNSCSQPQLAAVGIVTTRLARDKDGERRPRFDVYRRKSDMLGEKIREGLTQEELLRSVDALKEESVQA